jgi:hypothetical protein
MFDRGDFESYRQQLSLVDWDSLLVSDDIDISTSNKLFDQLEYICRKVRTNDLHFGGLQVVGSGDFFQLPPVSDH